jgi:polyhydroxyalkanoate synthesis regulator phasin
MNTDTPRTNEALAAILDKDGYLSEDNAPDVLVKLCRTMERERDQWRNEHDRVVREFQHRLTVLATSAIEATHYPEND